MFSSKVNIRINWIQARRRSRYVPSFPVMMLSTALNVTAMRGYVLGMSVDNVVLQSKECHSATVIAQLSAKTSIVSFPTSLSHSVLTLAYLLC